MRKLLLALALTASVGCAGLLSLRPTDGQTQQIRQTAARIADGVTVTLVALDAVGQTVNALPLSTAAKDTLDCGILKATGHDAPSVTVLKICGAIPATGDAPIGKALQALRTATTTPGLCGTVRSLLASLDPIIARLEAAGASVVILKVALGFTSRFATGCAA